jgi:NAD(P)-dependent dehydrogenase (short-subunit alcohol dehydrogenase family)
VAVVLITGCSSGIGLATAVELAARGDRVIATMRDVSRAGALRDAVRERHVAVEVEPLDVRVDESVRGTVDAVLERVGQIDVVVNNAGVGAVGAVEDFSDEDLFRVLDTNALGAVRVARAVLPSMRARGEGLIVNISSTSGLAVFPFCGLYAASKFALEAFSEALYHEVAPFGVRVALVEPGMFRSDLGRNLLVACPEGSPYAAGTQHVAGLLESGTTEGGDTELLARAVADVVHGAPGLRHRVGDSAHKMTELRRTLSDEEFAEAARRHVGL